nr:ABC transporter A family member 7-like isoform X2 [Tanacetum cinerariifolium]
MKNAIASVFNESTHRLCMWHITNKLILLKDPKHGHEMVGPKVQPEHTGPVVPWAVHRLSKILCGVADKQSGKHSGGMKRRLSVAISLIKISTYHRSGTALRNNLWNVVKQAKKNRAGMILIKGQGSKTFKSFYWRL